MLLLMFIYDFVHVMANIRYNSRKMVLRIKRFFPEWNQFPPQVPNDPPIGNAVLEEFKVSVTLLAQALTAQDNRERWFRIIL